MSVITASNSFFVFPCKLGGTAVEVVCRDDSRKVRDEIARERGIRYKIGRSFEGILSYVCLNINGITKI